MNGVSKIIIKGLKVLAIIVLVLAGITLLEALALFVEAI